MAKYYTQREKIIKYLKRKKSKGATNFELMVELFILDTRKRISEINSNPKEYGGYVVSEWESNKNSRYKRYYWVNNEDK